MSPSSAQSSRSSLTPFYAILGVLALVGIVFLVRQLTHKEKPTTQPVQVVMNKDQLARVRGISIGRDDAPVVIYEFADFQCPGCGQFASMVTPLVRERLVQPGKVRLVYYEFPLISIHQNAFLAARAGRCANEQGKFWEFHDIIYGQQPNWSTEQDPTDLFVKYAQQAGIDTDKFEQCLRSDRYAREVTESMHFGESLGINGTPTLIVNGQRLPSTPSYNDLERLVNQASGGAPAAGAAPAGGTAAPATR